MHPYKETCIGNNQYIRIFNTDTNRDIVEEWHRDREDRIIEVIENADWLLQMDNELPQLLQGKYYIKKESYHRVISGTGKLIIKLTKLI